MGGRRTRPDVARHVPVRRRVASGSEALAPEATHSAIFSAAPGGR